MLYGSCETAKKFYLISNVYAIPTKLAVQLDSRQGCNSSRVRDIKPTRDIWVKGNSC